MDLRTAPKESIAPLVSQPLSQANFSDFPSQGQKHYAKQTVYDAHLKSKKHLKAAAREQESGAYKAAPQNGDATPTPTARHHSKQYKAALYSHIILPLLKPLLPTIQETRSNVERRSALTARERELEADAPAQQLAVQPAKDAPAEEEVEEEERIYNPLKLPLGWDGKPIPYWLYKLHGLGVEYRCEICSDAVYMGRKNFERHFQVSSSLFTGST